jgi:hypothetical protein
MKKLWRSELIKIQTEANYALLHRTNVRVVLFMNITVVTR